MKAKLTLAISALSCRRRLFSLLLVFVFLPQSVLGEEVTIMLPGEVPLVLVRVPAGTFQMGSPEGERGNIFDNETQHEVTLTQDYYLGKTEVTQQQWEAVMGTPMRAECGDIAVGEKLPVYCVNWDRIAGPGGFIEKMNQLLGTTSFRLPTEAEWERGARAGTTTRYAHGDVLECSDDCGACEAHDPHMWWCGNIPNFRPKQVGKKLPNQFGLHDMHGNLWEIVNDRYEDFSGEPATDPVGPNHNGDIVMRGGGREAWINRSASRLGSAPDDRAQNNEVGFRLAAYELEGLAFKINAGLNDAWFNAATAGQGFFFVVFPDAELFFLSWFTFDVERPDETIEAILGEPGHRWVTAFGSWVGNIVTLDVELTSGGIFDSAEPAVDQESNYGTITIEFHDCNNATLTYDFPALGLSGTIELTRLTEDNVALCEALNAQ